MVATQQAVEVLEAMIVGFVAAGSVDDCAQLAFEFTKQGVCPIGQILDRGGRVARPALQGLGDRCPPGAQFVAQFAVRRDGLPALRVLQYGFESIREGLEIVQQSATDRRFAVKDDA